MTPGVAFSCTKHPYATATHYCSICQTYYCETCVGDLAFLGNTAEGFHGGVQSKTFLEWLGRIAIATGRAVLEEPPCLTPKCNRMRLAKLKAT